MKPGTLTELKNLKPGDIFNLTKGGVYLQKIKPPDSRLKNTKLSFAYIVGDNSIQSFTDEFKVYFIKKGSTPRRRKKRKYIQLTLNLPE